VLASFNTAGRRLRRWPPASVDRRCARRSPEFRPGRRNGTSTELRNSLELSADAITNEQPGLYFRLEGRRGAGHRLRICATFWSGWCLAVARAASLRRCCRGTGRGQSERLRPGSLPRGVAQRHRLRMSRDIFSGSKITSANGDTLLKTGSKFTAEWSASIGTDSNRSSLWSL